MYADDMSGSGMSDIPDGKIYIGMAYNKTEPEPSVIPSDYTWTLVKGEDGAQGPPGEDSWRVEISSTNGNIFKNANINTVLYVKAYKGDTDITNQIAVSRFRWTRVSNDQYSDDIWNQNHFAGTTAVVISTDDVKQRATFQCQLLDENLT
jgi:hypothetical protein